MNLDFRIDWGYQSLYTRASYHPEFIWDGSLQCVGGKIEETFHLAYPYVVFGPGHSAVEEPLPSALWQSRTQYSFDGMRFKADAPDNAVFYFKTASCQFEFTAGELRREKRIVVPVGNKYLNCNVIVTLSGYYWFQPEAKAGQTIFEADDFGEKFPVRSWARMRTVWIAPQKSLGFDVELSAPHAESVERVMHLVIMAAPEEYTPGNEAQVHDFFDIEILCDGIAVARTTRYLRCHDTRMQLLEDEWVRFRCSAGKHTFEIINHHPRYNLLVNRIILQDSLHDHLDLSLPSWALSNEKLLGRVFAIHSDEVEIFWEDKRAFMQLSPGWNDFHFSFSGSGNALRVSVKSTEKERCSYVGTVYDISDETPEIMVGYDMTTVPHDDNGGMDWLLDYTSRTRLGNMVCFRSFIKENQNYANHRKIDDKLLSRWADFCRTHHIYVESATDFDSGALVRAAGNMLHSVGRHEASFAVYGRQPDHQWQSEDMKSAMENFIRYMQTEIIRAKKVSPRCAFGDPSGAIRYVHMAGADFTRAETMVPHTQHICSQARPAAEALGSGEWGVHIAIQHAMQPYFENHLGIYYLSLMQPYLMGANMIYEEDSLFELFKEERQAWDDALTKGKRDMTRDFYRFVKTHPRQGKLIRRIAFIEGRYAAPFHGFLCNVQDSPACSVWGMFGNNSPQWAHLQPEKCRHVLDVLMPGASTHPLRQDSSKIRFFFSGTPYGDFDEVPIEASGEYLSRYSLLLNLGWNTMIEEDYRKLKDFVVAGGTLLISLPQFSRHVKRDFLKDMTDLDLWNNGDLSELCGVKVRGPGEHFSGEVRWDVNFGINENFELSSMPSTCENEDAPCRIADITIDGAEILAVDAVSGKPLVTGYAFGRGFVCLINTYAYPGHNKIQRVSAALVRKFASENLPECFVKYSEGEIFWNVRQTDTDAFIINLLNTDWSSKNNIVNAEIYCPNGICADVQVTERTVLTAIFADGRLFIPSSPQIYIAVDSEAVTVHGSGKHQIRVISAGVKDEIIDADLTGKVSMQIAVRGRDRH